MAIIRDDPLPTQLATVKAFEREEGIFWPPVDYRDDNMLPDAWIAMLTAATTQEYGGGGGNGGNGKDHHHQQQQNQQSLHGPHDDDDENDDEEESDGTTRSSSEGDGASDTSRILKAAMSEDDRNSHEVDEVVEQVRGVFTDLLKVTQLQRRLSAGLKAQLRHLKHV